MYGRPEDERRALLTLFWCTTGPEWVQKSGWQNQDPDLTAWCGIGLDQEQDNAITLVDLRRNGLSGAMPPELGELSQLRHLYLGDNELQGSIPPSLGRLSNLCILSLRGNKLKGDIVPELGNLTALRTLSLRDNNISGTIPLELAHLTRLKHLFLNNNNLRGTIPEELSNLQELEQMFLADNELEGPIPAVLGALSSLEELVLSGNQLNGPVPVELSYLTALTRLELDGNQLTGDIPPLLCSLTNLKMLYLNNNRLTGPVPPDLGLLGWMERLDLSNNMLTGRIPPELGQLFSLEILVLNNNRLSGLIPPELGRLHSMTLLMLGGNQLSEAVPIVGGKGLRLWLASKRRAYLNSWSMINRLSYLEKENMLLRRDNEQLRKQLASNDHLSDVLQASTPKSQTAVLRSLFGVGHGNETPPVSSDAVSSSKTFNDGEARPASSRPAVALATAEKEHVHPGTAASLASDSVGLFRARSIGIRADGAQVEVVDRKTARRALLSSAMGGVRRVNQSSACADQLDGNSSTSEGERQARSATSSDVVGRANASTEEATSERRWIVDDDDRGAFGCSSSTASSAGEDGEDTTTTSELSNLQSPLRGDLAMHAKATPLEDAKAAKEKAEPTSRDKDGSATTRLPLGRSWASSLISMAQGLEAQAQSNSTRQGGSGSSGNTSPIALGSPVAQMVLGLFGVGSVGDPVGNNSGFRESDTPSTPPTSTEMDSSNVGIGSQGDAAKMARTVNLICSPE